MLTLERFISQGIRPVKMLLKKALKKSCRIFKVSNHTFIDELGRAPVIVDLGAGQACFSGNMVERYEKPRMILVEPNPQNMELLSQRFKGKENISLLNAAVAGESRDKVTFYLSNNYECSSLEEGFAGKGGVPPPDRREIVVPMVTLGDIYALFVLERIDLLKVDIEGAEWEMLDKFSPVDFQKISQITVEFHDFMDPSKRDRSESCIQRLKDLGYTAIFNRTSKIPYYDVLFYDRRRLKCGNILKWLNERAVQYIFSEYGYIFKS